MSKLLEVLTHVSAVFQAGGLIVVVVEVTRKAFLASLVPVIVDAILNEHQVIADIVAFVSHGDFPRSRLGEKQRGKVLASWVTRKLRTIAQFSIRDMEGSENPFAEAPQPRASKSSKPPSMMGSLRRSAVLADDVPRSPAAVPSPGPVPEEIHELQSDPHPDFQEQVQPDIYVPATAQELESTVPQISEPASEHSLTSPVSQEPGVPSRLDNLDLGSDFSEFASSTSPQPEANMPAVTSEPLINEPTRGRDSLPSQKRFSSLPGGLSGFPERGDSHHGLATTHPETHEGGVDDWPQEALMYQSTWGIDGGREQPDIHRTPTTNNTEAVQKRYDGSDYGY